MNYSAMGGLLILFIIIYFLFRVGIGLAKETLHEKTFWGWVVFVLGIFFGMSLLNDNNPLGFIGFIPSVTYVLIKIINGIGISYSTSKKVKGVFLSSIGSVLAYIITHSFFGFGIPEATISAFIAAVVLGISGFNA